MKKVLIFLFIFTSFFIYGDEDYANKFVFVSSEPVGALLFAENCLGCHQISSFSETNPVKEDVNQLADRIDYKIYSPGSAMEGLSFLKTGELEKIARFLIYGKHIKGWVSEEYHGEVVEEQGSEACLKCHDNDRIKDIDIPSCSDCH